MGSSYLNLRNSLQTENENALASANIYIAKRKISIVMFLQDLIK